MALGDIVNWLSRLTSKVLVDVGDGVTQKAELVTMAKGATLDVKIQDQTTRRLSLFLGEILDTITIVNPLEKNATSATIETTGVVPIVGEFLCFQEDGKITQTEIKTITRVSGNIYTVTLGIPLDSAYTINGGCSLQNVDLNVDGSITPRIFKVLPKSPTKWDINRTIISMVLSTAGDDGLFGNLPALTNSLFFRKENGETTQNLFFVRDNSDFRLEGFDVAYPARSGGGGSFGMAARVTYNGQDRSGVTIRIDGSTGDFYSATVRSPLTGISKFRIKIQGHVVE